MKKRNSASFGAERSEGTKLGKQDRSAGLRHEGGKIIRTLYDGLSFDIIREQETFADGYFTNTSDTGIAWSPVSEGDGSRYRYIGDDAPVAQNQGGYSVTATDRASSRVALYANGQAVGVTRSSNYANSERSYFGTDLMGTVRSATTDSGIAEYYEYDVFGKPYGESVSDYAYTGKPYDPVTGMYNYGYRDYVPQTARFTTIDPIRDGSNWFAYCNNEPVNFQDAWGLESSDKSSKAQVKGDMYLGVTGNIVLGLGVDVSVVIVIDLDSPLESGLNISGGIAAGTSIGAGICGGYTSGDIEGKTAVTGSVSTPVPGLSLIAAVSEDGSPTIGGAVGPGLGFDVSQQNSMTISVNSVVEPIVEGAKVVLKKVADAALKTIDSALDNFR